ncbi:hypothetical protein CXQ81_07340 [Pseudomonas sp. 09C 129]|uniref:alpha-pore-forming tripartite toxin MakABE regulator n=1 Tax=Pseudomonas sp. 09C 129 TaxID=2054915 RepID=UPI000C6E507D|nr:hypothetical protein [Pseudomonas sp. 09C 129]AUG00421.1 hypothetical protein CXQ81_07340 [Pseudomonas sp. 09C 129]
MKQIDVLIVVDVEGALSSGDLSNNVYMIDTNKYVGSSTGEGTNGLHTACKDGQLINWGVTGVSPSSDVQISRFVGQMVSDGTCNPKPFNTPEGESEFWQGRVEARGFKGRKQYSVDLKLNGKTLTFDPYLEIKQ